MDLLEDPEVKQMYDKCKYIVKVWEMKFIKKHKRVPSKLDIREADNKVKHAYKRYFQLKTEALEQSFVDVEGFEDEIGSSCESESTSTIINSSESSKIFDKPLTEVIISDGCLKDQISEKVWGDHLNNKKLESQPKVEENTPKPNTNITKKLFCGSKFTKRNPRKSLSFSQRNKSDSDFGKQEFLSQPVTATESSNSLQYDENNSSILNDSFQIQQQRNRVFSQPVNVIHNLLDNNFCKSLRVVDTGWLERVAQNTGIHFESSEVPQCNFPKSDTDLFIKNDIITKPTKVDYDSDDIIVESDEETTLTQHIVKKRRVEDKLIDEKVKEVGISKLQDMNVTSEKQNDSNKSSRNVEQHTIMNGKKEENGCLLEDEKNTPESSHSVEKEENIDGKKVKATNNKGKTSKINTKSKKKKVEKVEPSNKNITDNPRRSARKTRVKVSLQEFSSDEDVFHTDDEDSEYTVTAEEHITINDDKLQENILEKSSQTKRKPRKQKTTSNTELQSEKISEAISDTATEPYELEFSVKPRIVAPRYKSIKSVLAESKRVAKDAESVESNSCDLQYKSKSEQAREKLESRIASGNLNENFVRINIKKKVFARGKNGRSFSKFKKAQWKRDKAKALCGPDMDMGGCDGGMLTCFNCGQIGHFARQCKATKGDGLLPITTAETEKEECPYPTLEEASKMAKESTLKIRRPNIAMEDTVSRSNNICMDGQTNENQEDNYEYECVFDDQLDEQLLEETEKLEQHVKKLDVNMYMDKVKFVEPYISLDEAGDIPVTPPEVFEALQKFGHSSFRPGQEEAVMRILTGKSTLVTLSTGSGKSLCYQLPAYLYSKREPCIALIISPLVSLMDDQVTGIAKCMKAGCLHSNQSKTQREKVLEAMSLGELSVLLVSPEAVVAGERQTGFGSFLRKLPPIAFACIDEAHCVSQWSHNFRPSYLMICNVLRESLGVKTILGLTATATKATRDSIIRHLAIIDGEKGIISDVPLPDNLILTVSKDLMRDQALIGLITSKRFVDCKSVIIYCTRRDECERIAGLLRTCLKEDKTTVQDNKKRKRVHLQAEPYHAGLTASRRRTIQNAFMSGELKIVVATVAFGMGINKSDIRAVVHYNMPSSFESYVQEVGRAGRDGLEAQCHVFLDPQGRDEFELRRHIHANSIDRHSIRKLLQKIFIPCSCTGICPKHEVAFAIESTVRELDIPEENISTLLCYLELHKNKYIQLLSPAYTHCKIISYGGPLQIRKVARDCPPLAMALALHKAKEGDDPNSNVFEFPVIDVASAMGWESGICKHKLKNLEWIAVNNQPKRSAVSVQFSNLGFRLLAPGNLSDDQLDEALDTLFHRVCNQEKQALLQLNAVHKTLKEVAQPTYRSCVQNDNIKMEVRKYFNSQNPLESFDSTDVHSVNEEQLVADIHAIINMYGDSQFTGRAIARIFQGIQSPNYPAVMWGRCKFWRRHLEIDFHTIVKIATREILKMR